MHAAGALSLPVQRGLQEGLKKNIKVGKKTSIKNSTGVSGWLSWVSQPVAKAGGSEVGANCFTDDPSKISCLTYVLSLMKEEAAAAAQPRPGASQGGRGGSGGAEDGISSFAPERVPGQAEGSGAAWAGSCCLRGCSALSSRLLLPSWGQGRLRCAGAGMGCKDLRAGGSRGRGHMPTSRACAGG